MCGCRRGRNNQNNVQRSRRNLQSVPRTNTGLQLAQTPLKVPQQQQQPPNLQAPSPFQVAADLRRIQKLRQEAIRRSLNK